MVDLLASSSGARSPDSAFCPTRLHRSGRVRPPNRSGSGKVGGRDPGRQFGFPIRCSLPRSWLSDERGPWPAPPFSLRVGSAGNSLGRWLPSPWLSLCLRVAACGAAAPWRSQRWRPLLLQQPSRRRAGGVKTVGRTNAGVGFEPTWDCSRGISRPLRLPFRHPGRGNTIQGPQCWGRGPIPEILWGRVAQIGGEALLVGLAVALRMRRI